jgi:DNA-binding transcriptional ArsR family regulator
VAKSKTYLFSKKEAEIARIAKALSHPARVEILKILSKQTVCICGKIVEGMPLAQATVSQHLKELKSAGIITGTIDGPKSCYCIDWKNLESVANSINGFLAEIQENHKRCC